METYEATVKLTRVQFVFLRDRYGQKDTVSPSTLVRRAVLEIIEAQAAYEATESTLDIMPRYAVK
jgi:hypothetical protein